MHLTHRHLQDLGLRYKQFDVSSDLTFLETQFPNPSDFNAPVETAKQSDPPPKPQIFDEIVVQ
jgi:hypothetical protein